MGDRFFVKVVSSFKETVEYLATLNKFLIGHYQVLNNDNNRQLIFLFIQGTTLVAEPLRKVTVGGVPSLPNHDSFVDIATGLDVLKCFTLEDFNAAGSKRQVDDLFADNANTGVATDCS